MIKAFHQKAKVGGSTNSTFLALIPKEVNPGTFDRFRPISLCNASYKILTKLLTNRIKPLLGKLISPTQGSFVKGRHILDNVIQVQDVIHPSYLRQEQGMLIKLDMANTFDWANLSFLFKVLLSFGFSSNFVNLIKACTEKPWIAPLVNGKLVNYFQAFRGIRQGCPLSPFLFILMADSLSRKLTAEKKARTAPGVKLTKGLKPLNHTLFADDTLLLGGASIRIAKVYTGILQKFCSISGALINKRKSAIYRWNVDQQTIQIIALSLGFLGFASWNKIKYLGLPIILGPNKLSLWKDASFLLAPKKIMEQISRLIREFLWRGGRGNQRKFHLVNWDTVKCPISEGGLQIRDPGLANLALGGKILWTLFSNSKHPVSQVIKEKYLKGSSLRNIQIDNNIKGTSIWHLYRRGIEFFQKHLYRIPGNGKNMMLWQDTIMGQLLLSKNEAIKEIGNWLIQQGILTLADISTWEDSRKWRTWEIPRVRNQMRSQKTLLEEALTGLAPVHMHLTDKWGWGKTGIYNARHGFASLQP
eukprot:PITA_32328